jgi:hypothetical protein
MSDRPGGGPTESGRYEIRLKGHLSGRWASRFDGMALTTLADGTTLIAGPVADQAALHGLLGTLRDLGLPLLSVTEIPPPKTSTPSANHPHPGDRND